MVCALRGLRAAYLRRSHHRLSCGVQPYRDRFARALGLISHAHHRIARISDRTCPGVRTFVLSHSGRGARYARIATAGLGLFRHHVSEWLGAHDWNHPGAHSRFRDISASCSWILFVSFFIHRFGVVDDTAAAHRAGGFSIAYQRLRTRSHAGCYHLFRSCLRAAVWKT